MAQTCRYYGISRQVFYVWHRRYETEGLAGLRDRSTRPAHCPHETPAEVIEKIIYLRQNYHFGPAKISMYLKRYHDVQVSNSGVWRILKRLDLNRLPASQRYKRHDRKWKRYEKPMPGHAVQVDVKFIAPRSSASRKKYYQFTAVNDCTRLRVLRIYDRLNQKTAVQFADFLLDKFPFRVEAIQTDNGSEFQSAFHWHLLAEVLQVVVPSRFDLIHSTRRAKYNGSGVARVADFGGVGLGPALDGGPGQAEGAFCGGDGVPWPVDMPTTLISRVESSRNPQVWPVSPLWSLACQDRPTMVGEDRKRSRSVRVSSGSCSGAASRRLTYSTAHGAPVCASTALTIRSHRTLRRTSGCPDRSPNRTCSSEPRHTRAASRADRPGRYP